MIISFILRPCGIELETFTDLYCCCEIFMLELNDFTNHFVVLFWWLIWQLFRLYKAIGSRVVVEAGVSVWMLDSWRPRGVWVKTLGKPQLSSLTTRVTSTFTIKQLSPPIQALHSPHFSTALPRSSSHCLSRHRTSHAWSFSIYYWFLFSSLLPTIVLLEL